MIKTSLLRAVSSWQLRTGEKLPMTRLAAHTDLNLGFLYRFNRGDTKRVDLEKLDRLCDFFGCTPDSLLWQTDEQETTDL